MNSLLPLCFSDSSDNKPKRLVESAHEHAEYQAGEIPPEWEGMKEFKAIFLPKASFELIKVISTTL